MALIVNGQKKATPMSLAERNAAGRQSMTSEEFAEAFGIDHG